MAKAKSTATFAGIPAVIIRSDLTGRPAMRQCAAVTAQSGWQLRCKAAAMRGKEVCRLHGGKAGRKAGTGRYAFDVSKVSGNIKEGFERHLARPDMTSLIEEIALIRAYLENYVATFSPSSSQHSPPLNFDFYDTLLGFVSRLSKLAKTEAEITWGPQHLITATQAMVFFNAVMDGVFRHITGSTIKRLYDEDRNWASIGTRLREAIVADLERTTGLAGVKSGEGLSLPAQGPANQRREKEDSREIRVEASG